ncbi:hypothetical protein [Pontimicrobium sp. MEBiC06410]
MATTYTVDFKNSTDETWTLCVYQELPDSPGLDSVSWQQTTVPRSGTSGVQWQIQYYAGVAGYRQSGGKGVYNATQILQTNLGKKWQCQFKDGVQQLFEDGNTTEGQLLISNQSQRLANLAIGMDKEIALVKKDVYSGNSAQFVAKPKYYVALFKDLVRGEVISGNQVHGPLEVVFAGGQIAKMYEAKIEGDIFVFQEVGTDNRVEAPYADVQKRVKMLNGTL